MMVQWIQSLRCWAATALLSGLVWGAAAAGKGGAITPEQVSAVKVPKLSKAPLIDGVIGAREWRESVAISGLAEQGKVLLVPRPTTFYLGWDRQHFYLAARTYIRKGYKPRIRDGRSDGLAYVFDEGLELVIKPKGKNVPTNNQRAAFKLFVNCLGHVGDMTKLDLGQQLKNWAPQFKVKARLTKPGSAPAGGRWWEMEMSTAPDDFELTGDHRAGDEWRLMLGMNHLPMWMQARMPCLGSYFDAHGGGYTKAVLVENRPGVQFKMDSLQNLATDGTASMTVSAWNPTAKPTKVSVAVDIAGAVKKQEVLTLPALGNATFKLDEKLPDAVKKGLASLRVTQGETTLLSYTVRFQRGAFAHMMAPVKPSDPNKFPFMMRFNPVRGWLSLRGDTYYLNDPKQAQNLQYRVLLKGSAKAIAEGTVTRISEWYFRTILKLPTLKPGDYTVEATMRLQDGRELGPMTQSFSKKDEAREYALWWDNKHGNIERIIPPYTAMKHNGASVGPWGRTYELSKLGMPSRIESQGEAVQAEPGRVVVVRRGKEILIPLKGGPRFTESKPYRVRFQGESRGAGLKLHAAGWVEQDGLVYVELTYGPEHDAVTIDALRLEYPLVGTWAESLVCIGPGANFSSKTAKLLPTAGAKPEGLLWSTLETGRPGSGMTVGSFYPTVFIGGDRRGFLWWGDNDKGWFPDDAVPAHDLVRQGDTVVFRNHIIGKPVELDRPRTIAFSYIATPFKPMWDGWRAVGATEDGTFVVPHRGVRKDSKTGKMVNPQRRQNNIIHPESRYPEEWAALWAQQKTKGFARYRSAEATEAARILSDPYAARNGIEWGHMSFTLSGYGTISLERHLFNYFGSEWETGGKRPWNKSVIDYAMYLYHRAFGEGGVHSLYFDITFPTPFKDPLTGLCYELPDGRIQKGYNGWNQRRFYMRLYALADEHGLNPFCTGSHSTNAYVTVAMPWLDAVLDGERNWNLDVTDLDWVDYYPIERMRSMSSPHTWGVPICWMANMDTGDKAKANAAKRLQGMWVWMHDSWRNPYIPQLRQMPNGILNWGMNRRDVVYHPYWRNPHVKTGDKEVLVSLWQLPDRVLLGVFNYNRKQPKDARMQIDLKALGLKRNIAAHTLWRADTKDPAAALNGTTLAVPRLRPHSLRLISVRQYSSPPAAVQERKTAEPLWNWILRSCKAAKTTPPTRMPDAIVDWGMARQDVVFHKQSPHVKSNNPNVAVSMWQLPDRILIAVFNGADRAKNVSLSINRQALGLTKKRKWQDFVQAHTIWPATPKNKGARMNAQGTAITVRGLKPQTLEVISVRTY